MQFCRKSLSYKNSTFYNRKLTNSVQLRAMKSREEIIPAFRNSVNMSKVKTSHGSVSCERLNVIPEEKVRECRSMVL